MIQQIKQLINQSTVKCLHDTDGTASTYLSATIGLTSTGTVGGTVAPVVEADHPSEVGDR